MSSISTLSERDAFRVRSFDLVLEHADGGGGYNGTGCLPCLPWCRKPVYMPGQHITGYLLIRPIRRTFITGVKIYFEGVYSTKWSDRSLKWKGRRNFYTDCVHLIRGRLMELESRWYRFDFEHVLPRNLLPSFKTQHCSVSYMATGLVTQPGMVDLQSYETGFQIQGPVDIRTLPMSYHQCVSKSSIKSYQTHTALGPQPQMVRGSINSISDLNGGADVLPNGVKATENSRDIRNEGEVMTTWKRVAMAMWINKQALVIGEELKIEVHIDNHTSINMEAMVQFEQILVLRPTFAICKRTSEFVPLGMLPIKKVQNTQATIWQAQVGPMLTETKSLNYTIPKVLTNITPPDDEIQSSSPDFTRFVKEREPLINIQYFVRLKVKPKDNSGISSSNQSAESLSIEIKIGNCDTGVHTEEDITSSRMTSNSDAHRVNSSITCSNRTSVRKQSNITCSRHDTMVSGASEADLLNSLDGSEESVFDVAAIGQTSNGYTQETEEHQACNEVIEEANNQT